MRLEVLPASTGESIQSVRELFQEYWSAFEFSPCFQNFSTEVEQLPAAYSPPGGRLGLAWVNCELAGCIALRPKDATRGEAKRLYVRPRFRGCGVGRALMDWMIEEARSIGYHEIVGDTLPVMASALKLYQGMGFEQLPPDPQTPQGAICIRLDLAACQPARR